MNRLFAICTLVFLSSSTLVSGEVDPAAVHKIVLAEFAAMRLPVNSPVCLEILPARNVSETGADPSSQLLRFLVRKGMRPRKASICYRPLPKGNVISIEPITQAPDRISARVTFSDVTITPDRDLGILYRRGVYELVRSQKGEWTIQSYKDAEKRCHAEKRCQVPFPFEEKSGRIPAWVELGELMSAACEENGGKRYLTPFSSSKQSRGEGHEGHTQSF